MLKSLLIVAGLALSFSNASEAQLGSCAARSSKQCVTDQVEMELRGMRQMRGKGTLARIQSFEGKLVQTNPIETPVVGSREVVYSQGSIALNINGMPYNGSISSIEKSEGKISYTGVAVFSGMHIIATGYMPNYLYFDVSVEDRPCSGTGMCSVTTAVPAQLIITEHKSPRITCPRGAMCMQTLAPSKLPMSTIIGEASMKGTLVQTRHISGRMIRR